MKTIHTCGETHLALEDLLIIGQNFALTTLVFVWNISIEVRSSNDMRMSRMHNHLFQRKEYVNYQVIGGGERLYRCLSDIVAQPKNCPFGVNTTI